MKGYDTVKRSISITLGDGNINHNNRIFITDNVDKSKTTNNITLIKENIEDVYHELFDKALEEYNAKQTRKDRRIDDYCKHIFNGKQEKPFYELVIQIGNRDDTSVDSETGNLATEILKEYAIHFERNNPHLKVCNLVIHLDETSPHIHLDFVPFATEQKRGLSTRVSLSKALEQQGFKSKGKNSLCTNQWIDSEKERLSIIMKKYGVEWKKLGTHNKHLSVLDYKKEQRQKEVEALEKTISDTKEKLAKENETSVALRRKARNEYVIATRAKEEIEKAKKEAQKIREESEFRARVARLNANMIHQMSTLNDEINQKERSKFEADLSKLKTELDSLVQMKQRFMDFVREEISKIKSETKRNAFENQIKANMFVFDNTESIEEYVERITSKGKQKERERSL